MNKEQLHKIEREHIEANKCVNLRIPTRTRKENRDAQKEYRNTNKDRIKEYQKKYREDKDKQ